MANSSMDRITFQWGRPANPKLPNTWLMPRRLRLLRSLNNDLRRPSQRWQPGVANVVAAVAVTLAVGPVFVALGDVAVSVHGHPDWGAVVPG